MNQRASSISAGAVIVTAVLCACDPRPPQARSLSVDMNQLQYIPASLHVSVGDTVRWINRDALPHTVTASDSAWGSGRVDGGDVWAVVITAAHDGEYVCSFHPGMIGLLRLSWPWSRAGWAVSWSGASEWEWTTAHTWMHQALFRAVRPQKAAVRRR